MLAANPHVPGVAAVGERNVSLPLSPKLSWKDLGLLDKLQRAPVSLVIGDPGVRPLSCHAAACWGEGKLIPFFTKGALGISALC